MLSSVQSTPLPAFTESFARDAIQFGHDWDSIEHPGFIKTDALLRNVFVEAIRAGTDSSLLKPCLEQLALTSGGHRDASLSAAQDYLSSFYIRNKPPPSVEEEVAFKSVVVPSSISRPCALCPAGKCVSADELALMISSLKNPASQPRFYCGDKGTPRFCRSCILSPPPCACGSPRTLVFHKLCKTCFQRTKSPKEPSGKALVAPTTSRDGPESSAPQPPLHSAPPVVPPYFTGPPHHQSAPYWAHPPGYGYHSMHHPPPGYYPVHHPGQSVAPEDDAITPFRIILPPLTLVV